MSQRREVVIAPKALRSLNQWARSEQEAADVRTAVAALGGEDRKIPSTDIYCSGVAMGYPVAFMSPPTFRVDIGRFGVIYRYDDATVNIGSIEVY